MNTKLYILLFTLLAVLVSCERSDPQEEVSYAVVSGKKVKSITKCISNGFRSPFEYKYDEDGNVIEINNSYINYQYIYEDGLLTGITSNYSYDHSLTYNEYRLLSEYKIHPFSGSRPSEYVFIYDGKKVSDIILISVTQDGIVGTYEYDSYIWDGDNIESTKDSRFIYSNIINNFNVPIPYLFPGYGANTDPLFNGFFKSANLISTQYQNGGSLVYRFSYSRNEDGDINRIDISGLEYILIEYYD